MVPSPNVFGDVFVNRFIAPLGIQHHILSPRFLELFNQFTLDPQLHVVDEKDNMHASSRCVGQFIESGIGGGRRVHSICGYPKIVFGIVDDGP